MFHLICFINKFHLILSKRSIFILHLFKMRVFLCLAANLFHFHNKIGKIIAMLIFQSQSSFILIQNKILLLNFDFHYNNLSLFFLKIQEELIVLILSRFLAN